MQVLTRPSAANSNFPYHVRTSQIGIMHNTPNGNLGQNVDNYSHHAYGAHVLEGGGLGHSPNFTELFTVSGSNSTTNNTKSSQYQVNNGNTGEGERRPSGMNGSMFTASAFIRGSVNVS